MERVIEKIRGAEPVKSVTTTDPVEEIVRLALSRRASDIHIEPREAETIVRLRVDGVITSALALPRSKHEALISRLKILAGLRTDMRHSAQDGRFRLRRTSRGDTSTDPSDFDLRISTVPTYYGEKAVLRILARSRKTATLGELGFTEEVRDMVEKSLGSTSGMILVVGPTGSGKTTTLYSMLEILARRDISIVTLEDPIEYVISGATQIPIHTRAGFTFSEALRSVVRQDPDVIMVGEIRDSLTAKLAIQSALTGHLVLSTLHTTSAAATTPRLTDMGVEPYLIASTLRLVIAQRLARRSCGACGGEVSANVDTSAEDEAPIRADAPTKAGVERCHTCGGSGYRGRISICESFAVTDELRALMVERPSASTITKKLVSKGFRTMRDNGMEKVGQGTTTLSEVLRVVSD